MKRTMKKMIALLSVFAILLTTVPVFAARQSCIYGEDSVSVVFYPKEKLYNRYFGNVASTKKIQVKSSNPKVGTCIAEKYEYGYSLYFKAKKIGTTVLTIKIGNDTKKVKATVAKYTNPVTSVKLGNATVSGSKFNKTQKTAVSYSKYANKKVKVNAIAKKGWTVQNVEYLKKSWMKTERVRNGAKIPVNGGSGYRIMITLKNNKTGIEEMVEITLK